MKTYSSIFSWVNHRDNKLPSSPVAAAIIGIALGTLVKTESQASGLSIITGILLIFAAVFFGVGIWRFRYE
jgi:hypothetical protein